MLLKLACAYAGYVLLNSWIGALLGYGAGALLQAWFDGRLLIAPGARAEREQVFHETVFQLMGRLAKSDGRISEREIAHTERFMDQLGMTGDRRRAAIALFKQGADPAFDVDAAMRRFRASCGRSPQLSRLLLSYLLGVSMADGDIDPEEEALLTRVGGAIGLPPMAVAQLIGMIRGQQQFGGAGAGGAGGAGGPGRPSRADALGAAYQSLGVKPEDSFSAIKKAYRKLISDNHPDKLIGQGVPADMVRVATERSQEIQKAFDLIKAERGEK